MSFCLLSSSPLSLFVKDQSTGWKNDTWKFTFSSLGEFQVTLVIFQIRGTLAISQSELVLTSPGSEVSMSVRTSLYLRGCWFQNPLRKLTKPTSTKKHFNSEEKTHKTLRRGSYRRAGRHVRTSWTCRITTAMLWKLEEKSKKVLRHPPVN